SAPYGADAPSLPDVLSAPPSDWVSETLEGMTPEEKVGQMIFVRAYGYFQNDRAPRMRRLFELVEKKKVGGICLFQGDIHTSALLVNRLQERSAVPLLVAADFEWGVAMRLRRSTRFPEAMALGATRDTSLAFETGRRIGREAAVIGIRQVYAPVADVNNNPANPVINTRSFGENPALVASMASAFARGLQSQGVLATAKHFPGHGDTDVDSHLGLPFMRHSRGRMDSVELVPFRSLIRAGVGSVMVAHCDIPSLGGKTGVPATLSGEAIDSLLLRSMGFRGLVVTDAMDMTGLTQNFGPDSAAVLAVEAGVDALLLPDDVESAMEGILAAVRSGRISPERIDRSVKKILAIKEWAGLHETGPVDLAAASSVIAAEGSLRLAREIARASVTLLKNEAALPLGTGRGRIFHVVVSDIEDYRTEINRPDIPWPNERVGDYYAGLIRARWNPTQTVRVDPLTTPEVLDSLAIRAGGSATVIVSVFSKARSAYGTLGLPAPLIEGIGKIILSNPRSVVVSLGSPYVLSVLPGAAAYVAAYSDAEALAEATAELLFGETPARGRLPVTIPEMFPYGSGIITNQLALRHDTPSEAGIDARSLDRVDSTVFAAIADSAFPAAQLVAVRDNAIVIDRSYGHLTYDREAPAVNGANLFDIASVTKVVATTAAVMKLFDEGKLSLDDRAAKFIPGFDSGAKSKITVEQLLRHTAGLPPFRTYFLTCATPEQTLDSVVHTALVANPGDTTIYSDFGFILLGKITEAVSGARLDRYVDSVFYTPLGMTRTMYLPPAEARDSTVPTEYDSVYRHRLVWGEVHDENAHALGGVSGHAGLFSTAEDLAVFLQMLMNGGTYGGARYLRPQTVTLFTGRRDTAEERGLGWDFVSTSGYTSAGTLFGPLSYGHTGFTGTSVWADPGKKIFVILLTNRVFPTRNNQKIRNVRPAVHDAVMRALGAR
ncbi:MAG TPA: glycoside hydrolase family 3 N-terminal domain-containing protein, partial [Bacteroidota bacterium]|nr:glycoside hydrolase family 3 N-terminal domain-containing protein [Bacteroidota bacterium]